MVNMSRMMSSKAIVYPKHMAPLTRLKVPKPIVGQFNPPKRLLFGPGPGNAHPQGRRGPRQRE